MRYQEPPELRMATWMMPGQRIAAGGKKTHLSRKNLFLFDALLLVVAFFLAHSLKRDGLILSHQNLMLLLWFSAAWFVSALVAQKFRPNRFTTYHSGLRTLFKANAYMAYCISFVIVFFGLTTYSRTQVFVTCLLLCSFFIINYMRRGDFELPLQYDRLLLLLTAVWFLSGLVTDKY